MDGPTVYALRAAGHEVLYIPETSPGIEDTAVLNVARREEALLLTGDLISENWCFALASLILACSSSVR